MSSSQVFNGQYSLQDHIQRLLDGCQPTHSTGKSRIYKINSTLPHFHTSLDPGLSQYERQCSSHDQVIPQSVIIVKCPRRYSEFVAERDILEACNRRRHPHIVSLITTFHFGGAGYLLMPTATTDLAELFTRSAQSFTMEWLTTQLAGLADALGTIHDHLQTAGGKNIFGFHGDIKASNVLAFESRDQLQSLPVLQLADFGSSQIFDDFAKFRNAPGEGGSGTYAAPECVLERPYGQAADVWSFGCLMLESWIWLRQGPQNLQKFADSRMHQSFPYGIELMADYFFKLESPREVGAEQNPYVDIVNPSVIAWIDDLRSSEDAGGKGQALLDLLHANLLVVDPTQRWSASTLANNLQGLVGQSDNKVAGEKTEANMMDS